MTLRLMMSQRHNNNNNNKLLIILFTIVLLFLLSNFQQNNSVVDFVFVVDAATPSNNNNNNNNNNNPYHILGVNEENYYYSSSSSKITQQQKQQDAEISKQYRKLCLKYHPDKNTNKSKKEREYCENKFKSIQHAYELIATPEARSKYYYRYTSTSTSTSPSAAAAGSGSSSSHHHRRNHDRHQQHRHHHHPDPIIDAFFQAYRQGQRFGGFSSNNGGVGGFQFYTFRPGGGGRRRRSSSSSPFNNNPPPSFFDQMSSTNNNNNNKFRSIYIEKIVIPLEVLYEGSDDYEFILKDKWWKRWRAAIHGKFIYISIYQGLMYALPILRASKILALIAAGFIIHATLPKPSEEQPNSDSVDSDELLSTTNYYIYKRSIRKGTKGNNNYENNNNNNNDDNEKSNNNKYVNNNSPKKPTKTRIEFQSKKKFGYISSDIIFEIYEQDHPLYKRIGDNLHTTIELTTKEYRNGCIKYVPHIISTNSNSKNNKNNKNIKGGGEGYDPIEIPIPPTTTTTTSNNNKAKRREDDQKKKKTKSTSSSTNYDNNKNNTIVIKGKGWPIRNNSYGDLIVHIKVVDDDIRKKKKMKRKGKYKKKK